MSPLRTFEWINILSELTQDGRIISDVQADTDIAQFLSSTLKECTVDEGIASADMNDRLVARIERIKVDQLNCVIPFDIQTMDHIGALIGAYLELSMENYRQSLYQTSRTTTPFAFFVMTTKRLLDDVNVLKKDRNRNENPRKRSRFADSANSTDDSMDEKRVNIRNQAEAIKQSSCSLRLSYSSTGSSSKDSQTSSFLTSNDLCDLDVDVISPTDLRKESHTRRRNEKKPIERLFSIDREHEGEQNEVPQKEEHLRPVYWAEDENVTFSRMEGNKEDSKSRVGDRGETKTEIEEEDGRRLSLLEGDQSPINTSFESAITDPVLTPAHTEEITEISCIQSGELLSNCSHMSTSGGTTASLL